MLIEVGPGKGILTGALLERFRVKLRPVEIDRDWGNYLEKKFPELTGQLIQGDFLELDLNKVGEACIGIIGNFPFNISGPMILKFLENRQLIKEVVGLFQEEVAERLRASPGSKIYGQTSVLTQAFYQVEKCFKVGPKVFYPPPKVNSAVVRLERKNNHRLDCNEELLFNVVKKAFNQRRKQLKNSLNALINDNKADTLPFLNRRPETLGVKDFISFTRKLKEPVD